MKPVVAVISPGAMGSAVAARLSQHGLTVRTMLAERSSATVDRARAAGMTDASAAEIAACDFILSIVPPGQARGLAERLAPALHDAARKPVYVDCNALNPATVLGIACIIEEAGAAFADAGIIGPPPDPDSQKTRIYLSGDAAGRVAALEAYGLSMPIQPGPIGAASALKMSYAGITKGFTALGAAMMLAASRAGTAEDVKAELQMSQPALLGWLTRQTPRMYSKAYRWVAEMEEIAAFTAEDPAAREFFQAAARLYERIAADFASERHETSALDAFCRRKA
jgi:3-hydroxyisobutyrate dehydrogenase-like beta-hydroxyacid dehydrogenase